MKSLAGIPIRVEMSEVQHTSEHALTTDELAIQIEEAKKGKARVDSKYVGNADGLNHVFDYHYDYAQFLDSMSHIIKEAKKRKEENPDNVYENTHDMIIQ